VNLVSVFASIGNKNDTLADLPCFVSIIMVYSGGGLVDSRNTRYFHTPPVLLLT
jgi:hypothetical protein